MSGLADTSAFETFERMAHKVEETEARAAAVELGEEQSGEALEKKFAALEQGGTSSRRRAQGAGGEDRVAVFPVLVGNGDQGSGFVIPAAMAGLAGALYPGRSGFEFLHWTMSGEVILMVLIGGRGTLVGPVIGALFFVILFDVVSSYWKSYPLLIGAVLILIVTYSPGGLLGLLRRIGAWRRLPVPVASATVDRRTSPGAPERGPAARGGIHA